MYTAWPPTCSDNASERREQEQEVQEVQEEQEEPDEEDDSAAAMLRDLREWVGREGGARVAMPRVRPVQWVIRMRA